MPVQYPSASLNSGLIFSALGDLYASRSPSFFAIMKESALPPYHTLAWGLFFSARIRLKVSPPLIRTKFTLMPVSFSNSLATTFADCSTTPMYTVISFDSFFAAGASAFFSPPQPVKLNAMAPARTAIAAFFQILFIKMPP